jgi:hypothetical protein
LTPERRRRKTIYGNDLYCEIALAGARKPFQVTYWDLWIALVLDIHFSSDWDEMLADLHTKREALYHRDEVEGLLNHVRLLRQTLARKGLTVRDILDRADPASLKNQIRKAKSKILDTRFNYGEKSAWMVDTPRKRRQEQAMRGYWHHFPVSPDEYAGLLERQYKSSGYYDGRQSWDLVSALSQVLKKHAINASPSRLFALYRAFLTVVIEKMEIVDDSFGAMGELYGQVFDNYVGLDWRAIRLSPDIFFRDLIALIIWEDHAFTWKRDRVFLASVDSEQVPLVESILRSQWEELARLELEYQAQKALTLLGMLYTEHQMFDRFVPIAKEMGSRAWERITTMSEMAEAHGRQDLALAVYEACLGPGMHEGFLRKKYKELWGRLGSLPLMRLPNI